MTETETRNKIINNLIYQSGLIYNDIIHHVCFDDVEYLMAAVKTMNDAAALLREHPHVITLDELRQANSYEDPVWFESHGTWRGYKGFWIFCRGFENNALKYLSSNCDDCSYLGLSAYGKVWRCWNNKPTKEQMEAIPWLG